MFFGNNTKIKFPPNFPNQMSKILAVIPARYGSKGIPRKNMRKLNGIPLIIYSLKNALDCDLIDDIVVSSDDEELLALVSQYHVYPLSRNPKLATDDQTLESVVYDAYIHAMQFYSSEYTHIITLQPTSPLLTKESISN